MTTTPGGLLLPLAVLVPFAGVLAGLVAGERNVVRVASLTIVAGLGIAVAIAATMLRSGNALTYLLGGWSPPLGVALRADALALALMLAVAVVIGGVALYARADFGTPSGAQARSSTTYWLLLLAVWGSLNLVFVSGDLFTLYVALELLTFAGVPLVCLAGEAQTLRAALRYLLYALAGSVLYLLGAVLLYGECGTLDIVLLSERLRPTPAAWAAVALMTAGLLAKTALYPLHLWLPPAHAGAPPAASAVLSALVVKGSFFIVIRLWFDAAPTLPGHAAAQVLAGLGAAAILFGSVVALRQERLKLLIAYSTLAQIGYLFIMFPLAYDAASGQFVRGAALTAGTLQALAHATAKAAMFMAAGLIYKACGHDRLAELAGAAKAVPLSVLAFGFGGVALMGVLPSGAYLAKKLLLDAAGSTGQWWWAWVLQAGGFLTASYVVLVLAQTLRARGEPPALHSPVPRLQEFAALGLALCSFALSLAAIAGPLPAELVVSAFAPKEIGATLITVAGGGVLALVLAPSIPSLPAGMLAVAGPLRGATLAIGAAVQRVDALLRQWPVAVLSLLAVALVLGAAMRANA
jgi:formate hydrogenlyase subunit 3/multisubunit Na+/H+ antiporter MnhD subunit